MQYQMQTYQIALDTNVLITALRSSLGASYKLLTLIGQTEAFEINLSVPLVLEYEEVTKRLSADIGLTHEDIDDILDYLCTAANKRDIFFLWRPFLKDPKDDMVLELAVEASCDFIVTYNEKDFRGSETFGLEVITPKAFLQRIGEL